MSAVAAQRAELGRDVVIRPAGGTDIAFITNAWLRTYGNSDYAKRVDRETYFREQTRRMMRILGHPQSFVVIAADPDDSGSILGYLVAEPSRRPEHRCAITVHWAYVRQHFRRVGVFRLMLAAVAPVGARIQYTHQTDRGRQVARHLGWTFNPYAVEE